MSRASLLNHLVRPLAPHPVCSFACTEQSFRQPLTANRSSFYSNQFLGEDTPKVAMSSKSISGAEYFWLARLWKVKKSWEVKNPGI